MPEQHPDKFDNLQPIVFLNKFNKMIDKEIKDPIKTLPKELKIFPLTQFPIPKYYLKMEGIYETGNRKSDNFTIQTQHKEDINDQKFLDKHNSFITKTIQKIITQNKQHQINLQLSKKNYQKKKENDFLNNLITTRTRTQSKYKKPPLRKIGSEQRPYQRNKQLSMKKEKPQFELQQKGQQNKLTYLQKEGLKRKQNFLKNFNKSSNKFRQGKQVKEFMSARSKQLSEPKFKSSFHLPKVQYNNLNPEDHKKIFMQELLQLQDEQNKCQRRYGQNVQKEINRFNKEVKSSIEKIKQQKFW